MRRCLIPAHNADLQDPKTVLRILLALVVEQGGELRVKATTYDGISQGRLLTIDFDSETGQLLLRASSAWGRAVIVTPESHSWTQPASAAPLERARVAATAEAERRAVPTDEQLADMEETAAKNAEVAKAVKEGVTPLHLRTLRNTR